MTGTTISRAAAALAAALAVLAGPTAAAAQTSTTTSVTTNTYKTGDTSADIDLSCKDLSVSSTGELSGTCNYEASDKTVQTKKSKSLGLESYVECSQTNGRLVWGSGGFVTNTGAPQSDLNTAGTAYLLAGTCGIAGGANDTSVDTLQLDARIRNRSGRLSYSSSSSSR